MSDKATDATDKAADPADGRPKAPPIVVGLGASAASPESMARFFSTFSLSPDQATIIVVQHREALNEERLRETLTTLDGLPVSDVQDGGEIEGGTVYLCAPDRITTVRNGRFAMRPAEQAPGERGTIDSFFVSLAEDRGEEAVGVMLRGTGQDGTLGVAALKDHGGVAIAELEADGGPPQPSNGQTPATLADFVLPADEIPAHIARYVGHLRRREERREFDAALEGAAATLKRIADVLRSRTGNDFHGYKQNTFMRRVQRRMQVVQIDNIDAYADFLRDSGDEVGNLFNDLLIGVTQFFRDPREFEVMTEQVIPKIFAGKEAGQQVRVWVLGCATGEEAYSLGIVLREHMATLDAPPQVQIFATDLDGRALARPASVAIAPTSKPTSQPSGWRAGSSRKATPIAW